MELPNKSMEGKIDIFELLRYLLVLMKTNIENNNLQIVHLEWPNFSMSSKYEKLNVMLGFFLLWCTRLARVICGRYCLNVVINANAPILGRHISRVAKFYLLALIYSQYLLLCLQECGLYLLISYQTIDMSNNLDTW